MSRRGTMLPAAAVAFTAARDAAAAFLRGWFGMARATDVTTRCGHAPVDPASSACAADARAALLERAARRPSCC